jgi:H+/Cl- antiporter ClcA
MTPGLLAWAAVAGPVLGLVSVFYVRLICWADARKPTGWPLVAAPIGIFAALGVVAIWFPQLLGNGKDAVQLAFVGSLPLLLALCLAALKPIATAACLGSGAPGGLFTPTLTLGALLGAAGGQAWALFWPGSGSEPGAYALIGAGAVLAASTQGPVSAIVLLLELTRRADATMVPLMLAIAGAILVARALETRSIYSGRIHTARHAVPDRESRALSAAARAPELLRELARRPDSALDVIDQDGRSLGLLAREHALANLDDFRPAEIVTARDLLLPTAAPEQPRPESRKS